VRSLFKTNNKQSFRIVKKKFVAGLTNTIGNINTSNISSKEILLNIPKHGEIKNVGVN